MPHRSPQCLDSWLDESGLIEHALQILRDISSIPMSELRVQVIDVCHPALSSPDNKTWSFPEWPAQKQDFRIRRCVDG